MHHIRRTPQACRIRICIVPISTDVYIKKIIINNHFLRKDVSEKLKTKNLSITLFDNIDFTLETGPGDFYKKSIA